MIQLILMVGLSPLSAGSSRNMPIQPCVWPNKCAVEQVSQFQPCVWPNKCAAEQVSQIQPCIWPHRCAAEKDS